MTITGKNSFFITLISIIEIRYDIKYYIKNYPTREQVISHTTELSVNQKRNKAQEFALTYTHIWKDFMEYHASNPSLFIFKILISATFSFMKCARVRSRVSLFAN